MDFPLVKRRRIVRSPKFLVVLEREEEEENHDKRSISKPRIQEERSLEAWRRLGEEGMAWVKRREKEEKSLCQLRERKKIENEIFLG
jgi:hypothetical protein